MDPKNDFTKSTKNTPNKKDFPTTHYLKYKPIDNESSNYVEE